MKRVKWIGLSLVLPVLAMVCLVAVLERPASADGVITVSIDGPTEEVYGRRPLVFVITLENVSQETVPFSGTIWLGGFAWSGQSGPIEVSTGDVYGSGGWNGIQYDWSGNITPGGTAVFTLPTSTSNNLGTFEIITADFGGTHRGHEITLVEGDHEPYWTFFRREGMPWARGEWGQVEIDVFTPLLDQLLLVEITSTCGLPLPEYFMGDSSRSYWSQYMITRMPEDAPLGICEVEGLYFLMSSAELHTFQYSFEVFEYTDADLEMSAYIVPTQTAGVSSEMWMNFHNIGPADSGTVTVTVTLEGATAISGTVRTWDGAESSLEVVDNGFVIELSGITAGYTPDAHLFFVPDRAGNMRVTAVAQSSTNDPDMTNNVFSETLSVTGQIFFPLIPASKSE